MPDLMQQLHAARPTDGQLDTMWPEEQRTEALARVLNTPSHSRRRPLRAGVLVAAATVAALAVAPTILGSGEAAAQADLKALAMAAVAAGGPVIEEGTFLHVKTEALQQNSSLFGDGETLDTNRESWVRWDGETWAIDTRPSAGWREYHEFARADEPSLSNPTPEFAASLPDHPDALRTYLDEHVSGSNSHEEAIFVAVSDLARSHFLPPETLAAALHVLADVEGVETRDVTVQGRSAVEISYSSFWGLFTGRHSITVDRDTARVISENKSDPGGTYDLATTLVEVVDEIPQEVRTVFQQQEDGARVFD